MSNKINFFIIILIAYACLITGEDFVQTTHGKVTGKVSKTLLDEIEYYSFMGIPYAAPPVNESRFLAPRPLPPWTTPFAATKERLPCFQYNTNVKRGQNIGRYGSDDCLYLDIFTPRPDAARRPILVFLHNENLRYSYNKTKDYAPDFFIEENVIIATISHRLSVFGFLSFENKVLRGNSGLRDIVMGLQWIKNNAERFGGDPNRITLMGSEGGSVAVDLLIHSDERELFNAAILQGGTAWSSLFLQDGARERAFKLAELEDFGWNSDEALKRLNVKSGKILLKKEIVAVPEDYNKEHQRGLLPFGPIVEGSGGLVIDYPERSTQIDIPVMIGFNSRNGLEKSLEILIEPKFMSFIEKDFVLVMPRRTDFRFDPKDDLYYEAVKDIKKFYFPKGRVTVKGTSEFVTYIGDLSAVPINDMTEHYARISSKSVFYYYFDYFSELSENKNAIMKLSSVQDGTWGAAAGDELCYLFKCPGMSDKYLKHNEAKSEEILLVRKLVRMWTNFAKYGHPTPPGENSLLKNLNWPAFTMDNKEYLHIGREISVKQNLLQDRFKFWSDFTNKWKKKAINGIVSKSKYKKKYEL